MTLADISLERTIHRIEAHILTIRQETTMTIEINVGVAEDAFQKNDLIKLDRFTFDPTIALSVADWTAKRAPHDAALLEVLRFVYRSVCERMSGYRVWLLLGDTRWQDDTRIIRH